MVDQPASADSAPGSVCPWCSAQLTPDATTCPSCGANLTSDDDHELPGVTAVDQDVLRGLKKPQQSRSRLLSWISGEYEPEGQSQVEAGALQPPDVAVQREILRLEIEAEVANLQAEADARYAEAVVDGRVSDLPEGLQAIATGSTLDEVIAALDGSADAGEATTATEASAADATPTTADAPTAAAGSTATDVLAAQPATPDPTAPDPAAPDGEDGPAT